MLSDLRLRRILAGVKLIAVRGPWFRSVGFRHLLHEPGGGGAPQPLSGAAAIGRGARFTPKSGFSSVYLACDPITALLEVQMLVLVPTGTLGLQTAPSTVFTVNGMISGVLDLTDPAVLAALGTTEQEMTGIWAETPNPPTQRLGTAAFGSQRISGIKYASAKNPGGLNLVVFPDRLSPDSPDFLEVFDPHGDLRQRIP
jgi:RES domain-containing protein